MRSAALMAAYYHHLSNAAGTHHRFFAACYTLFGEGFLYRVDVLHVWAVGVVLSLDRSGMHVPAPGVAP